MNLYKVVDIKPASVFTEDVFVDNAFILSPANCSISSEQLHDLTEWGFTKVYSAGKNQTAVKVVVPEETKEKGQEQPQRTPSLSGEIDEKTETVDASEFLGPDDDTLKAPASLQKKEPSAQVQPQAEKDTQGFIPQNIQEELEKAKTTYYQFLKYIGIVYDGYARDKVLDKDAITKVAADMCDFIRNNTGYVLRITSSLEINNENFLISHCMRSSVIAVSMGIQLRLPQDKLTELAVACMMHEIGMILLPPQLYMSDKPLTAPEKLMINTHPVVSYNILKKANFPLSEQLAVLEHHERMNGSGYPRHVTGDKISLYAKIIATACSFEAISAPREYKEERSTYEAMIELIRNANHQYDDLVTKVLLNSISLYPIGVYVYLSNGKVAQVVDVTPGAPKTPFVQILGETDENGNPKTVQIDPVKLRIIRVLNKKEAAETLGAFEKK